MNKIKAISNHEGLCWKCLQSFDNSKIHNIHIHSLGYGSGFDSCSAELQLCNDCISQTNQEWWKLNKKKCDFSWDNNDFYKYEYEDEIFDYFKNLPIQGRELVYNTYSGDGYTIDAQDWIDYELGILPHEKCKEYGFYSPQEIKAYNDRFPTCEYVTNRVWNDKSKASYCPFNASGDYGQQCSCNISTECYECKYYKKRITEIKDMLNKDFDDYMEYMRLKIREEELKKRFE